MEKNPKACEPCRRRKVRCDGKTPCQRCIKSPEACTYRLRTRVRKSAAQRAAAAAEEAAAAAVTTAEPSRNSHNSDEPLLQQPAAAEATTTTASPTTASTYNNVYQGVAEWTENSRLFYGPASQFAFLQQLHRAILSSSASGHGNQQHQQQDREVQEGGAGLDLFLQRNFFFGTASRIDISTLLRPASDLFPEVPFAQAQLFVERFKAWNAYILAFFTDAELDKMLYALYYPPQTAANSRPSQTKALTLAVLALGALSTPHTDTAEMLLAKAKYEAVLFDDTVSLQMIQYSLLLADYHTAMGRPNQVYLHIGTACRKAFALGLHRDAANRLASSAQQQQYRTTLWTLFVHENWHSRAVGRESALRMADISSPFPRDQPLLVAASGLAHIAETMARTIYTQRYDSLRKLFAAAEAVHALLKAWAAQYGLLGAAPSTSDQSNSSSSNIAAPENPASLILHNEYYHTILLTYRPFLVADFALASSADATTALWLRQACRTAIDSAQDCITFAHAQVRRHAACRGSRYNGFFFESSCAVLFFDILRHPAAKLPYHVEFIRLALDALDLMVDDEPVTNARRSIRQILRVVQAAIADKTSSGEGGGRSLLVPPLSMPAAAATSFVDPQPSPAAAAAVGGGGGGGSSSHMTLPTLPSLHDPATNNSQQLMYFPDLMPMDGLAVEAEAMDPLSHFHYDILATDLYSFFPLNVTPPSAAGHDMLGEGDGSRLGG